MVNLEMKYFTCDACGFTWGVPWRLAGSGPCPMCQKRELEGRRRRVWELEARVDRAEEALRKARAKARKTA